MVKDKTKYEKIGVRTNANNFKKLYDAGLLNYIDENFATDIQKYWEDNYDQKVDPSLHMAFMNLTGKKDVRLVPGKILLKEILPVFNDYNMSTFYGDKNLYDIVINPPRSAVTVLRNIRGAYFDSDYNSIDSESANGILLNCNTDLIIKPSKSNNGKGIAKLIIRDNKIYLDEAVVTIEHLQDLYTQDFIIQKAIQQHPNIAAPHPFSVNTLRMVTFRWKNQIRYSLTFARFGSDNDIRDNIGTGGIRLGVTDSGEFHDVAINQNGQTLTHHPTTGFCFADLNPIPNFDKFKQFAKDCHKNILHLDFISWDIAVSLDGNPIFIEANFAGSPTFYQLASQKPIFGDLTEEVLQYVSNELKTKKPLLMKKHRKKIEKKESNKQKKELEQSKKLIIQLKEKNKKMKQQSQKLEQQLEVQKKELDRIKAEYTKELNQINEKYRNILNSKSFRYTRPLRQISKLFK